MTDDDPQPPDPLPAASDEAAPEPQDLAAAIDESDSDVFRFQFHASKTQVRRIDQFLADRCSYLSRQSVQKLIEEGFVTVNGKHTKSSYKVKAGDLVEMIAPPEPVSELVPENIPLEIVYEDDDMMALNKQAGLMVHPARGRWTGTLVNALVFYAQRWSTVSGPWRPGILHRLDRNTTGIMLVAKSDHAHWRLARQFENRTIQKTYYAIAHGVPPMLNDLIDLPIGRDRYARERQAVRKIQNGGRPATTMYHVEKTFPAPGKTAEPGVKTGYSLIKLEPKTGRTHQLRVHLSAIGYPIVGDTMYGGRVFTQDAFTFDRQALHAAQITFVHPGTLATMTLAAPLPADITQLLERLSR